MRTALGAFKTTLLAALLAAACGTALAGTVELPFQVGGAYAVPAVSLKEARFLSTVHQQYDFSCGSAALSTLLTYQYGVKVNEQTVFEAMYRAGDQQKIRREGFSLLDMKRYLDANGLQADGFEAPLDKLAQAGLPAIVLLDEGGYNHFVVVKGVQPGKVLLGDPASGTRVMERNAFDGMWTNRILFVITNATDRARFNQASDWAVMQRAPLERGVARDGVGAMALPKLGPGDF